MKEKKIKKYQDGLFQLEKERKNTDLTTESYKRQIISTLPKDKNIITEVKKEEKEETKSFLKKIKKYFGN